jgi:hypothetical protein
VAAVDVVGTITAAINIIINIGLIVVLLVE